MESYQISIKHNLYNLSCDIIIYRRLPNGDTEILDSKMEPSIISRDGAYNEPTLRIQESFLPLLMKALNDMGVKLPDKAFNEGKLEATERHLEDMRTLVFHKD